MRRVVSTSMQDIQDRGRLLRLRQESAGQLDRHVLWSSFLSPSTRMTSRILIHAGDPGAANFIAPLLGPLAECGYNYVLFASPAATSQFRRLGWEEDIEPEDRCATAILQSNAAALLLTGTSEDVTSVAFDLITAAREQGVISVGVVDGRANTLARFRGGSEDGFAYAPDFIMVPDQTVANEMKLAGFPTTRVKTTGHPLWDVLAQRRATLRQQDRNVWRHRLFPNCAKQRPIVVFLSELSSGLDDAAFQRGPNFTLFGNGDATGRTEIALEEFLLGVSTLTCEPYLVLRLHPKNSHDDFANYAMQFDQISQHEPTVEVVHAADLIVGITTSLLDEAAILGCPTLSILPDPEQARWLPSIDWGMTAAASSRNNIVACLHELLARGRQPALHDRQVPVGGIENATAQIHHLLDQHRSDP